MPDSYYIDKLYPLQDRVLRIVSQQNLPFYLTGGTALSRHYLNHRYSDDIDLFVNSDDSFKQYVERLEQEIKQDFDSLEIPIRAKDFVRMIVSDNDIPLKVDLVNDLSYHYNGFEDSAVLGRVDNILNILSNKVSAIPRLEIKDFVDILFISKRISFSWKDIIADAVKKDLWVNPIDTSRYFSTIDIKIAEKIKWVETPNFEDLSSDFDKLADDILLGKHNTPQPFPKS